MLKNWPQIAFINLPNVKELAPKFALTIGNVKELAQKFSLIIGNVKELARTKAAQITHLPYFRIKSKINPGPPPPRIKPGIKPKTRN